MNLTCAEYHPTGKGLRVFSDDRFFARGAAELLLRDRRVREILARRPVNVVHFADHRYLMAWSFAPTLPTGLTVIAGTLSLTEKLARLFSPRRVGLAGIHRSGTELVQAVLVTDIRHTLEPEPRPEDVWLTTEELAFMWAWKGGRRPDYGDKRNSRLKYRLMRRVGAENDIGLLVRFRVMSSGISLLRTRVKHRDKRQPEHPGEKWSGDTDIEQEHKRRQ
ncbi:hypothetical protein F3J31_21750 [Enterobacter sp. Acro-832]|uniref:hypothetical protein n=1 Tax=Enterobacter sp. Acro-832 TaxID=2608348 RepID=UPI0014202CB3|nr:hypothetical protein [Enterobacter sp. Acro-832]NIG46423.1 hypothetical protein [Enterobacter sp. Acro-832]